MPDEQYWSEIVEQAFWSRKWVRKWTIEGWKSIVALPKKIKLNVVVYKADHVLVRHKPLALNKWTSALSRQFERCYLPLLRLVQCPLSTPGSSPHAFRLWV
jgi:hypothetical protein